MEIRITLLIFMVSLALTGCSTQANPSQIRGVISDPVENSIQYKGHLIPSNTYLLTKDAVNENIKACFNQNGVEI